VPSNAALTSGRTGGHEFAAPTTETSGIGEIDRQYRGDHENDRCCRIHGRRKRHGPEECERGPRDPVDGAGHEADHHVAANGDG
jgi:hypothetical protein